MVDVLNDTFGGTVLYTPILDVLNCLVLLKIKGIENGLTWVSDHAYVDFPPIANNTFSLGTIDKVSGSPSDILSTGPNGGAADAITAAMDDVIDFAIKTVRQEAILASCLLIVWFVIVFVGICRAVILLYKGGDDGVYPGPTPHAKPPSLNFPSTSEKHDLDSFFTPNVVRVPTYEQATQVPLRARRQQRKQVQWTKLHLDSTSDSANQGEQQCFANFVDWLQPEGRDYGRRDWCSSRCRNSTSDPHSSF